MTDSSLSASTSAPFSLSSIPPTAFTYVAEGGANLVAAYTGTTDNDDFLRGAVLRIRKKAHDAPLLSETTLKEEDASVAFTQAVVIPLLPPRSTPRLISIPIHDKTWFEQLAKHLQAARPASRRAVDDIDTDRGYVVLADNLVGTAHDESMQLAVEIKVGTERYMTAMFITNQFLSLSVMQPKWGFLPDPTHLSESSRPIKTQHCRFCLHRLHKSNPSPDTPLSHSSHSAAEDYCPLDLYSGSKDRVLKALHALVKSWEATNGKGNNLKLFYEGEMVIPSENTGSLGDIIDTEQSLPGLLADFITTSPLVKRLKELQRVLDPVDIEEINELTKAQKGIDLLHTNNEEILEKLGGEVSLQEYSEFVSKFLAGNGSMLMNEEISLRTLVIAYLLSASFKDCSMMITIKQQQDEQSEDDSSKKKHAEKTIEAFLVDVDVKSITRLARYAKLDRDLVLSFQSFQAQGGNMDLCSEENE